jgi:transcriptional regulator with XRE-family HTH domain
MIDMIRLASVLRERRESLGISAAEIARRVGVSPTYVWMIENAKPRKGGEPSRPSSAVLEKWARALGMDDRYARQVLRLAGYEDDRPDTASIPSPHAPFTVVSSPRPGRKMMDELFQAPVHFRPPKELRADVLAEEVHEVLQQAEETGRTEEVAGQLEGFLDYLRHLLRRRE